MVVCLAAGEMHIASCQKTELAQARDNRTQLSVARSDVAVFADKVSKRYSAAAIRVLNEFARMTP